MSDPPLMNINAISISFGGVKALDDYHLNLAPSRILGVIGPNGAGKTTLFNLITGFIRPDSGHIYFSLKDAGASIRCVIWRSTARRLSYRPAGNGEAVQARGRVSVYEVGGSYQLYVDNLEPVGQG
ncbi:MAG: hypothetical protein DSY89_07055, partial [Deltaproteobacteria bacterium]